MRGDIRRPRHSVLQRRDQPAEAAARHERRGDWARPCSEGRRAHARGTVCHPPDAGVRRRLHSLYSQQNRSRCPDGLAGVLRVERRRGDARQGAGTRLRAERHPGECALSWHHRYADAPAICGLAPRSRRSVDVVRGGAADRPSGHCRGGCGRGALARVRRGDVHYRRRPAGGRRLHGDVMLSATRARTSRLGRTIISVDVRDVRFPTSEQRDGSDAMNPDPDYSATYMRLRTAVGDHEGHWLTFTIGRGNELCVAAVQAPAPFVVGLTVAEMASDMSAFGRRLVGDSQLRWVGPEKGVPHLATAARVNAVWGLWAELESTPVSKLPADMSPAELVRCVDFRYLTDALTPEEAIALLERNAASKPERQAELLRDGYPA